MEEMIPKIKEVVDLIIVAALLWSGGRITRGLALMKEKAKLTWQQALTQTLIGLVSFVAIVAVILFVM